MTNIRKNLELALNELFEVSNLEKDSILVVGCSSSEVLGEKIGTSGSLECAAEIFNTLNDFAKEKGIFLACQCCEHLNRALVVEKKCAKMYNLPIVCAVPHEKAGGSFATSAYRGFTEPCLVEEISADAGIDIGQTFIGMHLKRVAVPVRCSIKTLGCAQITFARVRPKYIGGERAKYN